MGASAYQGLIYRRFFPTYSLSVEHNYASFSLSVSTAVLDFGQFGGSDPMPNVRGQQGCRPHHSHIVLDISANQSKGHADVPNQRSPLCLPLRLCPTVFSGSSSAWQGSLYAFLAEKQRRSGSNRTPDSYYRTLRHFFGSLHKSPDQVTSPQDVFSFAHGVGLSGREPSPVTVGARLSCISSFFKFLIRLDLLNANPCDPVERPKPRPSAPSGLSAAQVQSTPPGHPRYRQGQARPRHRPHSRAHRQTPIRGHQPHSRRYRLRRFRRLLPLYRQGRCARPP